MPAIVLERVSKRFKKIVLRTGYTTLKTSLVQMFTGRRQPVEYVQALRDVNLSV
ncbi:MAG: ABC transporter ATP-binding protein, partial [Candidatus Rokuibacteriota bacterium]